MYVLFFICNFLLLLISNEFLSKFRKSSSPLPSQRCKAQEILSSIKEREESWRWVPQILHNSASLETQFFGLSLLEPLILYRWNTFPFSDKENLKGFLVSKIVHLSSNEHSLRSNQLILQKLNQILVYVRSIQFNSIQIKMFISSSS
jgi:hypothetical protein